MATHIFDNVHCNGDSIYFYLFRRDDTPNSPFLVFAIMLPTEGDEFDDPFLATAYKEGTKLDQFQSFALPIDTKAGDRFDRVFPGATITWEILTWNSQTDFSVRITVVSQAELSDHASDEQEDD